MDEFIDILFISIVVSEIILIPYLYFKEKEEKEVRSKWNEAKLKNIDFIDPRDPDLFFDYLAIIRDSIYNRIYKIENDGFYDKYFVKVFVEPEPYVEPYVMTDQLRQDLHSWQYKPHLRRNSEDPDDFFDEESWRKSYCTLETFCFSINNIKFYLIVFIFILLILTIYAYLNKFLNLFFFNNIFIINFVKISKFLVSFNKKFILDFFSYVVILKFNINITIALFTNKKKVFIFLIYFLIPPPPLQLYYAGQVLKGEKGGGDRGRCK